MCYRIIRLIRFSGKSQNITLKYGMYSVAYPEFELNDADVNYISTRWSVFVDLMEKSFLFRHYYNIRDEIK